MMNRKNNSGFTLIEMMVSMTILAMILMGVAWIMSQMSRSFSDSQKEVQLQDNMQATYSIVSGLVKESQSVKKGIEGKYNSVVPDGNRLYIFAEEVDRDRSNMYLEVPKDGVGEFHIVEFVPGEHRLYLYSDSYNPSNYITESSGAYTFNESQFISEIKGVPSATIRTKNNLLSNNVKSFAVVDRSEDGYVVISLELEYGRRKAEITQNVYLRNSNISVENDEEEEPTDTPTATPSPTVSEGTGFTVSSSGAISNPTKDTISSHADITVNYEAGYDQETEVVEEPVYEYQCPNGHKLEVDQVGADWNGFQTKYGCHRWGECEYQQNAITVGPGETLESKGAIKVDTGLTQPVTHVLSSTNSGALEIKNTSLSNDYNNVKVLIYFEDPNAYFAPISGNIILKADTAASTGRQACTYKNTTTDSSGRCKYVEISIPQLKKAETYTEDGEDKVRYDSYVFDFSWFTSDGKRPVMCAYSVSAS